MTKQSSSEKSKTTASKPAGRERKTPSSPIRAYATLQPATTESQTSQFIAQAADSEVIHKAKSILKNLGFKVTNATSLSVAIEAPQDLFEKVFQAPVKQAAQGGLKKSAYVAPQTLCRFQATPQIPQALQSLVSGIVFPAASETHI